MSPSVQLCLCCHCFASLFKTHPTVLLCLCYYCFAGWPCGGVIRLLNTCISYTQSNPISHVSKIFAHFWYIKHQSKSMLQLRKGMTIWRRHYHKLIGGWLPVPRETTKMTEHGARYYLYPSIHSLNDFPRIPRISISYQSRAGCLSFHAFLIWLP